MPIETNCDGCGRRISVNEVFAGGTCRCPYCKNLVFVPARDSARGVTERPEVPGPTQGGTSREGSPDSSTTRRESTAGGEMRPGVKQGFRRSALRNTVTVGVVVLAVALVVIAIIHLVRR